MTTLAIGTIQQITQNVDDGSKFDVYVVFQAMDGTGRTVNGDVWICGLDPNAASVDLRTQCETTIKSEATKQLGIVFGVLDGARLLAGSLGF